MNVLYVGLFSSRGAMADDYICMGNYLSKYCNLYGVIGAFERDIKLRGAKDMLQLSFSVKKKSSYFHMGDYQKIASYAKKNCIDAVFFKTPNPVNGIISAMLYRVPQIYYIHDYKPHSGTSVFYNKLLNITDHLLKRNCNCVVVASEKLRSLLIQENSLWKHNDVQVVPLGVLDNLLFQLPSVMYDIDLLFFGRIEHYKGIDWFLNLINRKRRNLRVTIAGKGDLPDECLKECMDNTNVTIINRYVEDRELAELINRSRIVVLPYRNATGTQVIQTAFYYKKCVIASDVGNFSELIDDGINGILVKPQDEEAMLSAIDSIMDNPVYADSLGMEAFRKVERDFDNDRIAVKYVELLNSLVEKVKKR